MCPGALTCRMGYNIRVLLEALDAIAAQRQRSSLVIGRREGGHTAVVVLRVLVVLRPSSVAKLQHQYYQEDDDDEASRCTDHYTQKRTRQRQYHRRQSCGQDKLFFYSSLSIVSVLWVRELTRQHLLCANSRQANGFFMGNG